MNKITKETGGFIWEVIFFCILAILLLFLTFRGFSLPFYWDTGAFLIPAAESIAKTGNLLSYVQGTDYPHFFLLPWVLSFFINFPNHIVVIHVFSYFMSVFFLIVMYYLGKTIANRTVGAALSLTFLTNPLFLAQTNLMYFEIIGAAFRYLAIIYLLRKKYFLFTLISFVAFVTIDNSLILIIISILYLVLNRSIGHKIYWFVYYLFPLIYVTASWLFIHFLASGWWLLAPHRHFEVVSFETFIKGLDYVFFAQGRWIFTFVFLTLFIIDNIFKFLKIKNNEFFSYNYTKTYVYWPILIASFLMSVVRWSFLGDFVHRYTFSALSIFYLLTFIFIYRFFHKKLIVYILIVLNLIVFQNLYQSDCRTGNFEDCPVMLNLLKQKKNASLHLETISKNKLIAVTFPESTELSNTYLGFVNHPLNIVTTEKLEGRSPDFVYMTPTPVSTNFFSDFIKTKRDDYFLIETYSIDQIQPRIFIYAKR